MYKKNDIKSLQYKIADLEDLKLYIYSKNKKKIIRNKIRELNKELKFIMR